MTAIRLEFDAVLKVEAGAVPGSAWDIASGPGGLPVAFRSFVVEGGRPLRVAVAVAPDLGATAAVAALSPLVDQLEPRCIAMCGVGAGRRGKVHLGDVVAADRLDAHDAGDQDPTAYQLRDDWKAALAAMDVVAHFRDEAWFQTRPLTTEWREHRTLVALRDGTPTPWPADPALEALQWQHIVASRRERELLATSDRALTDDARRFVDDLLSGYMSTLPDPSPVGTMHPFRLHVAPIGSGARAVEDEAIGSFVSQAMRQTLGLELEPAVVGALAHRPRPRPLDWVVMKGVMDFAGHGRDDHFKDFAARASAECLLWFLREHLAAELIPGLDDLLTPGTLPLPDREPSPSVLLDARHAVVPWRDAGRSGDLAKLNAWTGDPARVVAVRLLHGEAGTGKTRLAIEWVRRRRERYDVAGFLKQDPGDRWLEKLCWLGSPVLIVIDDAEGRADLEAVLDHVATFAARDASRRRIRVLVLARGVGDWWAALPRRTPELGALLGSAAPIELAPLAATAAQREAVFEEASRAFAAVRNRPAGPRPPIALDDVRFARVRYLHMAALAAVDGLALDARTPLGAVFGPEG